MLLPGVEMRNYLQGIQALNLRVALLNTLTCALFIEKFDSAVGILGGLNIEDLIQPENPINLQVILVVNAFQIRYLTLRLSQLSVLILLPCKDFFGRKGKIYIKCEMLCLLYNF